MRRLSVNEVHARKVEELGLDSTALDLDSIEVIAAALRRAASFLCPCTAPRLVQSVLDPLRGLVEDRQAMKDLIEDVLDSIIAHGDILEEHDIEEGKEQGKPALLYTAPASFVSRESGSIILIGIATDHLSALPDELQKRIEYVNHVRRLSQKAGEKLKSELSQIGLIEISYRNWLRTPPIETPHDYISSMDSLLESTSPSHDVQGLSLLDSERPVRYYRGRWVQTRKQTGRFVARRIQAFGSPLWCYVQMREGNPERLIDLPIIGSLWRGWDEAWHLQMAIDAERDEPQVFRVCSGPADTQVIQFFSPVPTWATRRWDAIGDPVSPSNCLFAYKFSAGEMAEEVRFMRQELWLEEMLDSGQITRKR